MAEHDEIGVNEDLGIIQNNLSKLFFDTPEDYASELFDLDTTNDPALKNNMNFLKNTKLSEVQYADTEDKDFFKLVNAKGESIKISNRDPTNGEFRSFLLRQLLDKAKKIHPNENIYNTIKKSLRTKANPIMTIMTNSTSDPSTKLLIPILFTQLQNNIIQKELWAQLDEPNAEKNNELQQKIWEGIDVEAIYIRMRQFLTQFENHLNELNAQRSDLHKRGYDAARDAARDLYDALGENKKRLMIGELSFTDFAANCGQLITGAQKGELKNQRALLGSIWHEITLLLNWLTRGAVSVSNTKSIEKIMIFKTILNDFECDQEKPGPENKGLPGLN